MGTRQNKCPGACNIGRINVALAQRHIGAIFPVKNVRKGRSVPDSQNDKCRQALGIGGDMGNINPLFDECPANELSHLFIADTAVLATSKLVGTHPPASDFLLTTGLCTNKIITNFYS